MRERERRNAHRLDVFDVGKSTTKRKNIIINKKRRD